MLPADVLIKLFGLMLYMLCARTDILYQADPGSIRAVSADTLRQWDETQMASQQAPKLFVGMAKACLGWIRAASSDDQDIAVDFFADGHGRAVEFDGEHEDHFDMRH